jgi:hypothetical protein
MEWKKLKMSQPYRPSFYLVTLRAVYLVWNAENTREFQNQSPIGQLVTWLSACHMENSGYENGLIL